MRWLRFLIKLSFICNICYLAGFLIRMIDYSPAWEQAAKHIMILGSVVAAPLNIITLIALIIALMLKKVTWREMHPYIVILNVLILLLQLDFLI